MIRIDPIEGKPWLLDVWEKLDTKAPCPDKARPYCCYLRTVIFYLGPSWTVRPWHHYWIDGKGKRRAQKPGQSYEQWDQIEHELTSESPIEYQGEVFRCGGGTVVWLGKGKGWWMKFWARRERTDGL